MAAKSSPLDTEQKDASSSPITTQNNHLAEQRQKRQRFISKHGAFHMATPTSQYLRLLEQKAELDAAIAAAEGEEVAKAIETCRELIEQFDLTPDALFGKPKKSHGLKGQKRAAVEPKYRDPATGATWTGRGKAPRWLGSNKEVFLISK
ncbi:H-NS histone family protein [Paraburkholderia fungorum]|uniref:H-NS histone family protein n=1 Tax=Paraburkholderia fungorum TaxID=134537 RepID=UPI00402BDA9D